MIGTFDKYHVSASVATMYVISPLFDNDNPSIIRPSVCTSTNDAWRALVTEVKTSQSRYLGKPIGHLLLQYLQPRHDWDHFSMHKYHKQDIHDAQKNKTTEADFGGSRWGYRGTLPVSSERWVRHRPSVTISHSFFAFEWFIFHESKLLPYISLEWPWKFPAVLPQVQQKIIQPGLTKWKGEKDRTGNDPAHLQIFLTTNFYAEMRFDVRDRTHTLGLNDDAYQ